MRQLTISEKEAGQRLDRWLSKYMAKAPKSFFYKMMRKKNIVVNGKRAEGNEKLNAGDQIALFLSEETILGFQEEKKVPRKRKLDILYEDSHVLFVNKPINMLSQKARADDVSLNEFAIAYLSDKKELTREDLKRFSPSVCNRLDRNTSGIVAVGKSVAGLQMLSEAFRERTVRKYYRCLVKGRITREKRIEGYLKKEESLNQVSVCQEPSKDAAWICTQYRPLEVFSGCTYLEAELITGRSHQIRAHLASEGHPLFGDAKYGDRALNEICKREYDLRHQLLHCARLEMPQLEGTFSYLSEKIIEAPLPAQFQRILEKIREKDKSRKK